MLAGELSRIGEWIQPYEINHLYLKSGNLETCFDKFFLQNSQNVLGVSLFCYILTSHFTDMDKKHYWLMVFTGPTWRDFLAAGGEVAGFGKRHLFSLRRMKLGDYLISYVGGLSSIIAVSEITSEAYEDHTEIWKDSLDDFPARIKVKSLITLRPETAIPIVELKSQLRLFRGLKDSNKWGGMFQSGLKMLTDDDGDFLVKALMDAQENPVHREIKPYQLARKRQYH